MYLTLNFRCTVFGVYHPTSKYLEIQFIDYENQNPGYQHGDPSDQPTIGMDLEA